MIDGRAVIDAAMAEDQWLDQVMTAARALGWRVAHFHDSRRQIRGQMVGDKDAKGFPDLVMVRGNRLLFAELKSEKGRTTRQQQEWLNDLMGVCWKGVPSVEVFIWKPSDWDSVERTLR